MRNRYVLLLTASVLVIALAGLVLAQSPGARWRVETAIYYISNGWLAEALEHLQQAVRLSPEYAEAYLLLALAQHSAGDVEGALRSYAQLQELMPESAPYGVLVGDIYFAAGMLDEAEAAYVHAVEQFPDAGLAHYGLARVLEARGDDGAIDALRSSIEHAPDFLDARVLLGRTLRLNGQADEALDHLLYAIRLNNNHAAARFELALVYEALERVADAENEYRMVLRLDPDNEEAASRLRRLLEAVQANT